MTDKVKTKKIIIQGCIIGVVFCSLIDILGSLIISASLSKCVTKICVIGALVCLFLDLISRIIDREQEDCVGLLYVSKKMRIIYLCCYIVLIICVITGIYQIGFSKDSKYLSKQFDKMATAMDDTLEDFSFSNMALLYRFTPNNIKISDIAAMNIMYNTTVATKSVSGNDEICMILLDEYTGDNKSIIELTSLTNQYAEELNRAILTHDTETNITELKQNILMFLDDLSKQTVYFPLYCYAMRCLFVFCSYWHIRFKMYKHYIHKLIKAGVI